MSIIDPNVTHRDWAAIRARLGELVESTNVETTDTPAGERAVLAERAMKLGRRLDVDAEGATLEILRLTFGGHRYAIGTEGVVAVVQEGEIVPLPGARGPVSFLASWRGRLLTALDLRPLFGLPNPPTRALLVLGAPGSELGFLVDAVDELDLVRVADIQAPAAGGSTHDAYLRGALPDATPLLDAARVVTHHPGDG